MVRDFVPISEGQLVTNPQGQLFLKTDRPFGTVEVDVANLVEQIALRVAKKVRGQPTDEMLTVEQAAELLNCSLATIHRLTKEGSIPSVKIGHLRRYKRSALLDLPCNVKGEKPNKPR